VNFGNDYVSIGYKQAKRINWSQVISEIEKVTQTVDENFSLDGSINENGVTYTSFSFNAEDSRINVAGQTRTSNERTFTLIADLTDAVENSPRFMNADTRTYSKQQDEGDGFRSSIRLDFNLEE